MHPDVFLVIVAAAVAHALWNSLLKFRLDPAIATTMLAIGGGVSGAMALAWTGLPEPQAAPFIAVSALIHLFYWCLLGKTYQTGEFGHVYPIARGLAPVATTLAGVLLLGESPLPLAWLGILSVVAGVAVIAVFGTGSELRLNCPATRLAATTALCITGYSMVDGMGAREAGSALAYTALLYVCNGWIMLAYGLARQRRELMSTLRGSWPHGLLTGTMSLLCYGAGVWAMTKAPIGLVAATRETSILFAVAIGALLFREPLKPGRVVGSLIVFGGLVVIRLV